MSDFVVQNYGAENKANLFNCAVTGALAGFATKYAYPLTQKERISNGQDAYMQWASSQVGKVLKEFRKAIKSDAANDVASDIFTRHYNGRVECDNILRSVDFASAKEAVKEGVTKLVVQYNNLKEAGLKTSQSAFENAVKAGRSTNLFLAVGALVGISLGLAKEVLNNREAQIEEGQRDFEEIV